MSAEEDSHGKLHIPDTDMDLPRSVLSGFKKYSNFQPFAEGGTAKLELCLDQNLGRWVIMKRLKGDAEKDPIERKRFLREARVTALIQHPNTVPVYTLGVDDRGEPYFTMKKLEGDTLRDVIEGIAAKDPRFVELYPIEQLVEVLVQVGQSVAFAHTRGVVHRDLKPANILVGAFGEVIVLDWGVAKVWDIEDEVIEVEEIKSMIGKLHLTKLGNRIGTPLYMSPEQALGRIRQIDHRTDIFSLGSILYEILTLEHLVWGTDQFEIYNQIVDQPFLSPSEKSPGLDINPDLEAICMWAIEKDPDDRYEFMSDLIDDLVRFQRNEPVTARSRAGWKDTVRGDQEKFRGSDI